MIKLYEHSFNPEALTISKRVVTGLTAPCKKGDILIKESGVEIPISYINCEVFTFGKKILYYSESADSKKFMNKLKKEYEDDLRRYTEKTIELQNKAEKYFYIVKKRVSVLEEKANMLESLINAFDFNDTNNEQDVTKSIVASNDDDSNAKLDAFRNGLEPVFCFTFDKAKSIVHVCKTWLPKGVKLGKLKNNTMYLERYDPTFFLAAFDC